MADVTISELAKVVGVDVDKLLSQVKDAGLPHKKADEIISNDDKAVSYHWFATFSIQFYSHIDHKDRLKPATKRLP